MKVKVYRCRLCYEAFYSYSGKAFANCPFCGAHEDYIVEASFFVEPTVGALSDQDVKDLLAARELEIKNTNFYKGASKAALKEGNTFAAGMFKILSKVENEHDSALKKVLLTLDAPPDAPKIEGLDKQHKPTVAENLKAANERENRAVKLYTEMANRTKNPRVRELFLGIAAVEGDHIDMTQ